MSKKQREQRRQYARDLKGIKDSPKYVKRNEAKYEDEGGSQKHI